MEPIVCAVCHHNIGYHHDGKRCLMCARDTARVPGSEYHEFTKRIDPSPPSGEDGDDEGNPGAID